MYSCSAFYNGFTLICMADHLAVVQMNICDTFDEILNSFRQISEVYATQHQR